MAEERGAIVTGHNSVSFGVFAHCSRPYWRHLLVRPRRIPIPGRTSDARPGTALGVCALALEAARLCAIRAVWRHGSQHARTGCDRECYLGNDGGEWRMRLVVLFVSKPRIGSYLWTLGRAFLDRFFPVHEFGSQRDSLRHIIHTGFGFIVLKLL